MVGGDATYGLVRRQGPRVAEESWLRRGGVCLEVEVGDDAEGGPCTPECLTRIPSALIVDSAAGPAYPEQIGITCVRSLDDRPIRKDHCRTDHIVESQTPETSGEAKPVPAGLVITLEVTLPRGDTYPPKLAWPPKPTRGHVP